MPRIPMIPSELPFQFKRLKFQIKFASGMTINKAQGETLKVAGIDFTTQCFSLGQLYVALSRVTSKHLSLFYHVTRQKLSVLLTKTYFSFLCL